MVVNVFSYQYYFRIIMNDNEDLFSTSRCLERTHSLMSDDGGAAVTQEESLSLLAGGNDVQHLQEEGQQASGPLLRGLKRGLDTLIADVKKLKEQVLNLICLK